MPSFSAPSIDHFLHLQFLLTQSNQILLIIRCKITIVPSLPLNIAPSVVPFVVVLSFFHVLPSFDLAAIAPRTIVELSLPPHLTANPRPMPPAVIQTVAKSWDSITSFVAETTAENTEIAGDETPDKRSRDWTLAPNVLTCPPQFDKNYCFNGGECYLSVEGNDHSPLCRCSSGFHGHRCEYSFAADLYGMERTHDDESAAPTGENGIPHILTTPIAHSPPPSLHLDLPTLGVSVLLFLLLLMLLLLLPLALRQRCSNDETDG